MLFWIIVFQIILLGITYMIENKLYDTLPELYNTFWKKRWRSIAIACFIFVNICCFSIINQLQQ